MQTRSLLRFAVRATLCLSVALATTLLSVGIPTRAQTDNTSPTGPTAAPEKKAADEKAPDPALEKAKADLAKLDPKLLPFLDGARYLMCREHERIELEGGRRMPNAAMFGRTLPEADGRFAPWAIIRIAAFVIAGHYGRSLEKELATFALAPALDKECASTDVFAEGLLYGAIHARKNCGLPEIATEIMTKRAPKLATLLEKHAGDVLDAKNKDGQATLPARAFHVAGAISALEQCGLRVNRPSAYTFGVPIVLAMIEKGGLSEENATERDARSYALLLGATLKLIGDDKAAQTSQKAKIEKCRVVVTKLFEECFRKVDEPFGAGGLLLGYAREFLPPWTKREVIRSVEPELSEYGSPKTGLAPLAQMLELENAQGEGTMFSHRRVPPLVDVAFTLMAATIEHGAAEPPLAMLGEENIHLLLDAMTKIEKSESRILALRSSGAFRLDIPEDEFVTMVNDAVMRAVEWLASTQDADGCFPGSAPRGMVGGHALCLLTLLDAELPRDDERVQKAVKRLRKFNDGRFQGTPYDAGIVLMAYQKYYEAEQRKAGAFDADGGKTYLAAVSKVFALLPDVDKKLATESAKLLINGANGQGWSYNGAAPTKGAYDNSNSQYAVLGLRAASLLGIEFNRKILELDAKRWLDEFSPVEGDAAETFELRVDAHGNAARDEPAALESDAKKTQTFIKVKGTVGGWGYSGKGGAYLAMTAAGISSLAICRDEMKLMNLLTPDMNRKISLALEGARRCMGTGRSGSFGQSGTGKGYTYTYPFASTQWTHQDGWGMFYDMYSVERACVLADMDTLGGNVDWYRHGAMILLEAQEDDGSWPDLVYPGMPVEQQKERAKAAPSNLGQMQTVDICMAILFLKKASVPTQELEKRRRPVTGHKDKQPTVEPKPVGAE